MKLKIHSTSGNNLLPTIDRLMQKFMRKEIIRNFCLLLTIIFTLLHSSAGAYETFRGPSELIYWDPQKADYGYVMFSVWPDRDDHEYTYLIDMQGNVVNKWKTITPAYEGQGYNIEKTAMLTEKGSIIQGITNFSTISKEEKSSKNILQELDWEGNLIWEFSDQREGYVYHHDFKRIWNNHLNEWTLIFTSQIPMSQAQAKAAGADPSVLWNAAPDGVVEVDMKGNIVWEWWSLDHVIQDQNPNWPNYGVLSEHPEKFDLNWGEGLASTPTRQFKKTDYTHQNALNYNQTLDQVVVSNSIMGEFYVIDHGGTFVVGDFESSKALAAGSEGDIMYRWGNPSVYDSGKPPSYNANGNTASDGDQQLYHHHDIQWIEDSLPGAGHFLVFNNGSRFTGETRSELIEINPYAGAYPTAPYLSEVAAGGPNNQIVWSFASRLPNSFYSYNISGVQRLPNGNTLGISGRHGHFFQVTPEGEVVWEYINPVIGGQIPKDAGLDDIYKKVLTDADANRIFKGRWYPPDHPGFVGKDLTPKGKITDVLPN